MEQGKELVKVCAYVVTVNSGLAPNPFHGVCTLAVCTPNHMRANLGINDYIVGISSVGISQKQGWYEPRILYAMKIDACLGLDDYYAEYSAKRGNRNGSYIEQVGDAIYKMNDRGNLEHIKESEEHLGLEEQDIHGNRVFIGENFWHFGAKSILLPDEKWAKNMPHSFIGIRYIYNTQNPTNSRWSDDDFEQFLNWLNHYPKGIIGIPIDMASVDDESHQTCARVSEKSVVHCNNTDNL